MRLAVISDIHGNLDALHQVLHDIGNSSVDAVFCLGDNVGYGPEPEQVVELIQDQNIPSVMGNHELALSDRDYLNHHTKNKWYQSKKRTDFLLRLYIITPI